MSVQGKRDAAVGFVPLGDCRRQKKVPCAKSTVNQEGTCRTKMAGRDCRLEKCACEPLLGREEHYFHQAAMTDTIQLRNSKISCSCRAVHDRRRSREC